MYTSNLKSTGEMFVSVNCKFCCLSWDRLTWNIPHWGWRRSCWGPQSCLSVCSGSPQHLRTNRKWSSWRRWCFCPAGYTSLFQSETNTRQRGKTGRVQLWDRLYCPLRFSRWKQSGSEQMDLIYRKEEWQEAAAAVWSLSGSCSRLCASRYKVRWISASFWMLR